jgi:hypothetical protein
MVLVSRMTTSQIDKLGDRLRKAESISNGDLTMLQAVRAAHDDVMASITVALGSIVVDRENLRPTSRLKTVGTILEKLRRERTRLSTMQDIAGVRLVVDGGRSGQDRVVQAIQERFPGAKVVDRRETPSHGYRAVHVLVRESNCTVEVQVRTFYQDFWAQLFESLGDSWGRQIRYGDPPDDPGKLLTPGSEVTRREAVSHVLDVSEDIDGLEIAEEFLELVETTEVLGDLPADEEEKVMEAREQAQEYVRRTRERLDPLVRLLES